MPSDLWQCNWEQNPSYSHYSTPDLSSPYPSQKAMQDKEILKLGCWIFAHQYQECPPDDMLFHNGTGIWTMGDEGIVWAFFVGCSSILWVKQFCLNSQVVTIDTNIKELSLKKALWDKNHDPQLTAGETEARSCDMTYWRSHTDSVAKLERDGRGEILAPVKTKAAMGPVSPWIFRLPVLSIK